MISSRLNNCDVLIATIGKNWLTCADHDGSRRLDNHHDPVRREILTVLKRNVKVIPVLVDGAAMPLARELPPPMAQFADCQKYDLSNAQFERDLKRLVEILREAPNGSEMPRSDEGREKAMLTLLEPPREDLADQFLEPALDVLVKQFGPRYSEDFIYKWRFLQKLPGEVCIKRLTDRESRIVWWNRSLIVRAGSTPEELRRSPTDLLWADDAGRWIGCMDRLAVSVNRCICHAEPRKFPEEPYAVSIRFPLRTNFTGDGYVASIAFGFTEDYSAHAAAAALGQVASQSRRIRSMRRPLRDYGPEERLMDLSGLLDIFFCSVPFEICVKTADSRLKWCNPQFEDLVGIELEKLRDSPPERMWPEHRAEILRAYDRATLTGNSPILYRDELQDDGGNLRERFGIRFVFNNGNEMMIGSLGFDSFHPEITDMFCRAFETKGWPCQLGLPRHRQ